MNDIKTIVGQRLRSRRLAMKLTVAGLARSSGLSNRYIISAEQGDANLSLTKLEQLSRALCLPIEAFVRSGTRGEIDGVLAGRSDEELRAILDQLRKQFGGVHVRPFIALLGVRGAGKSSVGRVLAERFDRTFLELDARIEEVAGLSLAEIFSLHGEEYYREMEREALNQITGDGTPMVIATGGGIVTDAENYRMLRDAAHTIWLSAHPEDHWNRVIDQGDRRPMRDHPQAMAQLRNLLVARAPLYGQADLKIDTHAKVIDEIVDEIVEFLEMYHM